MSKTDETASGHGTMNWAVFLSCGRCKVPAERRGLAVLYTVTDAADTVDTAPDDDGRS